LLKKAQFRVLLNTGLSTDSLQKISLLGQGK
jgi:hypothetical protein